MCFLYINKFFVYLVSFDIYRPSKCGSYFCRTLYYQTIRCHIQADCNLNIKHHEVLKLHCHTSFSTIFIAVSDRQ